MKPAQLRQDTLKTGRRITLVGALVNIILVVIKLGAGVHWGSQALVADGFHSISDLFTDAVVLFGIGIGRKPPDAKHPFGHARIETMASAVVGLALMATGIYLGWEAAVSIYVGTVTRPGTMALVAAGLSIALKEILYQYTVRTGRRIKSQLMVANAWHHRTDALSSVAVFVGLAGIAIKPGWYLLDPLAALLVSVIVIKVGTEIVINSVQEVTDAAPTGVIPEKIRACALSVPGVMGAHDIRVRSSGGFYQMEIHVVVHGDITVREGHAIAKAVEKCLERDIENLERAIVHVDPHGKYGESQYEQFLDDREA